VNKLLLLKYIKGHTLGDQMISDYSASVAGIAIIPATEYRMYIVYHQAVISHASIDHREMQQNVVEDAMDAAIHIDTVEKSICHIL